MSAVRTGTCSSGAPLGMRVELCTLSCLNPHYCTSTLLRMFKTLPLSVEHFLTNSWPFPRLLSWSFSLATSYMPPQYTHFSNKFFLSIWHASLVMKSKKDPVSSVQSLSPVWLCDPMDCTTPGFPVHRQVLELAQTQVHLIGGAIQPSHSLLLFSIFPSIRVFSSESVLPIRWPKYWSFNTSVSVLPMNIWDWFPLRSPCSLRVFSNTTIQKHQFFGAQLSL